VFKDYKKGQRVRIYLEEIGSIFGTIVQDHQIANHLELVHIDGTRTVDHRWLPNDIIWAEHWEGQYALERVSDSRLTQPL